MELLISEFIHLILGLVIGLIGFYLWKDKRLIWFSMAVSVLIDLDHLIDYWLFLGYLDLNPIRFFTTNYFGASKKIYVFFHGWEYSIILLFLAGIYKKYKAYFLVAGMAILAHLLFDSVSNSISFQGYSIIFRMFNNFSF